MLQSISHKTGGRCLLDLHPLSSGQRDCRCLGLCHVARHVPWVRHVALEARFMARRASDTLILSETRGSVNTFSLLF